MTIMPQGHEHRRESLMPRPAAVARLWRSCRSWSRFCAGGRRPAQVPDWPSERPPRPLPAREVKFPPYAFKTLANGLQVIAVSHHEQPAVSLRLIVARRRRAGSGGQAGRRRARGRRCSIRARRRRTPSRSPQPSTRSAARSAPAPGSDLIVRQRGRHEGQPGRRRSTWCRTSRKTPGVRAAGNRARSASRSLSGCKVSYDDPDYLAGVVFDRLVYGSASATDVRDSGTPASIASDHRATISSRSTRPGSAPTTPSWPSSAT